MNKTEEDRKAALIQLLIDQSALDADRDDAAMDLGEEFDDESVLNSLIQVANNPNEIDMILASCGEAIGKIWVKKGYFDEKVYKNLSTFARDGIYCVIKSRHPDWIETFHMDWNRKEMEDDVQSLIDILLDKTAREDEWGDAAIDLREYADKRALEALIKIASDPEEDIVIIDNCAESIGEILIKMHEFDEKTTENLIPFARKIVCNFVLIHSPELISRSLREKLSKKLWE